MITLSCSNCAFFKSVEGKSRGRCASPAIVDAYGEDADYYPRVDKDGWCPVHKPKDVKND